MQDKITKAKNLLYYFHERDLNHPTNHPNKYTEYTIRSSVLLSKLQNPNAKYILWFDDNYWGRYFPELAPKAR